MALNYDNITASVRDEYRPDLIDNIFESSALLQMLLVDGRVASAGGKMTTSVNGGTKIIQPLEYAKGTAVGVYANYDVVDITPPEFITGAEFTMKNYFASLSFSHDEQLQVNGDNQVINLLNAKMKNAEKTLKDTLATALYTGATTGLIGLDTAIHASNTYGGINSTTYSWWQSTTDATAHTAANMKLSTSGSYILNLLAAGWLACQHNNEPPNLILVSQAVWDIYEFVLQASARYTTVTSSRAKRMADGGFQVLEYRGIPVVVDDYINTTGHPMYMCNTDYLTLYYHPDNNFEFTGFKESTNQPHARVGQITFTGQLAISNRRHFYRWSDLNN